MTVTTVRPNVTNVQVNVATSGGVAVHTVLSDTNNATRAQGNVHAGRTEVGIPSVTVSSTVRLKQARIGLVYAHEGADVGHIEKVNYRFVNGLNGVAGPDTTASSSTSTFPAAGSPVYGPQNTSAPGGGVWTQAIVDALRVRIFWLASVNNAFLNVSEAYVQFDTNVQPVVSAVTVTGETTTSRPTVAFVYTGDDLQVARRAKVFSAAQYGIAGFDPETSPHTWDSGEVLNGITSFTIDEDLLNGTTYRVYVKAAQAWPGPEGPRWYSAWANSSSFTVTFTPPPTPTFTVTQQLDVPHYRNMITVSFAGINVLDPDTAGFEGGIGFWVADANCAVTTSATNPKSGLLAMQMTATALGTMVARSGSSATGRRVDAGQQVSATASFRAAVTPRTVSVGVRFFDVAGNPIGVDSYGTGVVDNTTGYVTATFTGTSPVGSYSMIVLARVASAAAAEVHRVDEAGLMFGSSTTWTPGGYAQNGEIVVRARQYISETINRNPLRNLAHAQLYSGGGLLLNADGFTPRQANDSAIFRLLDRPPPEAPENTTQGMIEWVVRVGAFSYLDIGAPHGVPTTDGGPYMFPATPGMAYTLSAWLWSVPNATTQLGIFFVDEFNTVIGSVTLSPVTNLTNVEQYVAVTAIAPAGTVYARGVYEDTAGVANVSFFITNVRFRHATTVDQNWPGQTFRGEWYTVRNTPIALPEDGTDSMVIYDHEAPPDRYVVYTAQVIAETTDGQPIASALARQVQVYMTPPVVGVLKAAFAGFAPENAFRILNRARGDTITRVADEQELHAAGRDADPIFGRDWMSGDTGTLTVILTSELDIYRLEQLVPSAAAVLIQWRLGGQVYAHVGTITLQRLREVDPTICVDTYALATVTYSEQARPD